MGVSCPRRSGLVGKSNHLRPTILVEVSKPEMGFRMYHVSRLKSPKRSMQRFSLFFSEFAETARFGVMLLSESNSGACRVLGFGRNYGAHRWRRLATSVSIVWDTLLWNFFVGSGWSQFRAE